MVKDINISELSGFFIDEVDENIEQIETNVLELENDHQNKEFINNIFRGLHTIKGSSGMVKFLNMEKLTHSMENVFDMLRNGEAVVTQELIDLMFKSIDVLKVLRNDFKNNNNDNTNIEELLSTIEDFKKGISNPNQNQKVKQEQKEEIKEQKEQKEDNDGSVGRTVNISFSILETTPMISVRALVVKKKIESIGKILEGLSDSELENYDYSKPLKFLVNANVDNSTIREKLEIFSDIKQILIEDVDLNKDTQQDNNKNVDTNATTKTEKQIMTEAKNPSLQSSTIRVDINRIENLINLVGELIIDDIRLNRINSKLKSSILNEQSISNIVANEISSLSEVSVHMNKIVSELQEGLMQTRMIPIDQILSRFPRMIRDLCKNTGKEINFTIEGKETELDRNLIEEINDPLIHLLRNSADHGIESPEDRLRKGKNRIGNVCIKAYHKEGNIVVEIIDDGKGIDAEVIKKKAIEKGMVTAENAERMTQKELINLIFMPGFSTAEKITQVSGRGVGMDIVKSHIEKLNGMIDIETEVDKGSKFTMKLPLTLAIIPSLMVQAANNTFAVPITAVAEIIKLEKDSIRTVKDCKAVCIRDEVIPLVDIREKFNLPKLKEDNLFVVVIGFAEKRRGVVVDELVGNQDIVVKSLGDYLGKVEGITGATILGDGKVGLIIDIGYMFR